MSENPLEFGMVYVVVKLTLCYVFQRVLFFVVYEAITPELTLEDSPLSIIPPILCHGGLDNTAMVALRFNVGGRQAA
ncbi:hypothetical protein [uncultured Cardiobacterium sp.]|mgnify:CR=1 FL=1|uniref:hypothetical protein n=1 Tax=uncultured Cardiobacterium sp. TaxID=417619 RepID=UPI0026330304|nr:hypothetical protein [uncultured Cardiobacterium sp.]